MSSPRRLIITGVYISAGGNKAASISSTEVEGRREGGRVDKN